MVSKPLKSLLSFILVFVLTVAVIFGLNLISRNVTQDIPAQLTAVTEEVGETKLSAIIPEKNDFNFMALIAFLLIVFATVFVILTYFKIKIKKPERMDVEGRKYNPREEITFKNTVFPEGAPSVDKAKPTRATRKTKTTRERRQIQR